MVSVIEIIAGVMLETKSARVLGGSESLVLKLISWSLIFPLKSRQAQYVVERFYCDCGTCATTPSC